MKMGETNITLSTWLDPDESISERVASVSGGSDSESGADNVTPISPSLLSRGLDSISGFASISRYLERVFGGLTGVDDEMSWVSSRGEKRCQGVDVLLLIAVRVARGVRGAGSDTPGVVVGNVGSKTSDGGGAASSLVDLSEKGGGRADVGRPSQPSGVTGVEIHGYVWKVQGADGILDTLLVGSLGIGTLGDAQVGDQVGQGIRLWKLVSAPSNQMVHKQRY